MHTDAIQAALALFREPGRICDFRERPLPTDVALIIRLAANESGMLQATAEATGESVETLSEACIFYLQQMLFVANADSYRVLGTTADAPQEQLRENYRWLMRWLHPDRNPDGWEVVYADRVNAAWQDLKTPDRRAEYDLRTPMDPLHVHAVAPPVGLRVRAGAPESRPMLSGVMVRRLPAIIFGILGLGAIAVLALMYWAQSESMREAKLSAERVAAIAPDSQLPASSADASGQSDPHPAWTKVAAAEPAPSLASSQSLSAPVALEAAAQAAMQRDAERRAAEKLVSEQLEINRLVAERVAKEKLLAEAQPEQAAADALASLAQLKADKLAADQAAALLAEQLAAEEDTFRVLAEKLLAERLAGENLASQALAAEKLAQEEFLADRLTAEKFAAEKLAAEKLAAEKFAAEKFAAEKFAAEKFAAEKFAAEKFAAEQLAAENLAAQQLVTDTLAADRLAAERNAELLAVEIRAAEKRAAERLAREQLVTKMTAASLRSAERLAAQEAARQSAQTLAAEKLASERLVAEKIAAENLTAEKLAADKRATEAAKLAAERLALRQAAATSQAAVAAAEAADPLPENKQAGSPPARTDAQSLVGEMASAYASGNLAHFDSLFIGASARNPGAGVLRSRMQSTQMRYLEVGEVAWNLTVDSAVGRVSFRDTFVPRGAKKSVTQGGEIRLTVRLDSGKARISSFEVAAVAN